MDISVIICTCDRLASLDRVLASAVQMSVPDATWEFLIIDNGSANEVEKIVERYKTLLPLRMEKCPERGLSRARNCGVNNARGRYIAWTDDDVILDQRWLLAYWEAFCRRPDAAVFGGKVVPLLEPPCTPWFQKNLEFLEELVAARDFGPAELPLSVADGKVPFGANYAVRAIEQRKFLYDVNLGAGTGRYGEETAVIASILESGARGYWVPGATVYHVISPARQTTKEVVRRYLAQGATYYPGGDHPPETVIVLAAKVALIYLKYIVARSLHLQPRWVRLLKYYAYLRGGLETRLHKK